MRALYFSSVLLAAIASSCDGGGGTETGASTGNTTDATTGTPTTGAPTTGTPTTTGDATTGDDGLINGCDPATADDHTADAETTVNQVAREYLPKCIRIKAGASVKIVSTFSSHPLVGGLIQGGVEVPDPTSPIAATSTGAEAVFTFASAGSFGYYCDKHGLAGMSGAVFVE